MKQGGQLKFFWDNIWVDPGIIVSATSTSTSSTYSINFLTNGLETNRWMASSSANQTILLDAPSLTRDADFLYIDRKSVV